MIQLVALLLLIAPQGFQPSPEMRDFDRHHVVELAADARLRATWVRDSVCNMPERRRRLDAALATLGKLESKIPSDQEWAAFEKVMRGPSVRTTYPCSSPESDRDLVELERLVYRLSLVMEDR